MDIVTTSLDALLQRATNPQNQNVDTAAVETFCVLVNKEKDGCHIGVKLLATRIHSKQEKEVLQALHILDTCMQKCGSSFQSEVGKFRFLNEMIKLVSPKYLGSQTPLSVRQKVLQLMYLWTLDYPKETKIKEAYDMLKKQGVIREVPLSVCSDNCPVPERQVNSVFHDEEKSKLLQKLLQSKNPEDLQAANRLIKCMVKEDDKRAELKSRRVLELEAVHNNVRLLHEMLDSYRKGFSSHDEVELIKELHQSCERLRPSVLKLAAESQQNEEMLNEVLHASDELGQVFEKYKQTIVNGNTAESQVNQMQPNNLSLLDFGALQSETSTTLLDDSKSNTISNSDSSKQSDLDVLCDIFTTPNIPASPNVSDMNILKPVTILKDTDISDKQEGEKMNGKLKALEDLDALGEHLLKQNLNMSARQGPQFQKISEKIPMNLLPKQNGSKSLLHKINDNKNSPSMGDALSFDLNYLLEKPTKEDRKSVKVVEQNGDDLLVDISEDVLNSDSKDEEKCDSPKDTPVIKTQDVRETAAESTNVVKTKLDLKLSDLYVELESIKPSSITPVKALDEKNGISVTLHFAKDKPRDNVAVVVVTIVSKNELPLKNILFRAIVPKTCKVKLQPASGTDLPPFNPFLPPSAITQVMLIANPEKVKVSLKFIVSYNIDDETTTEMGDINCLPVTP